MAADFDTRWVEIELKCFGPNCRLLHQVGDPEAAAKKRMLEQLRKYGLIFNETAGLQIDPESVELFLLAKRIESANSNMNFGEALHQAHAEKRAG